MPGNMRGALTKHAKNQTMHTGAVSMISAPEENNDIASHVQDANANALCALQKRMRTLYCMAVQGVRRNFQVSLSRRTIGAEWRLL
jgi:hypothetical protein